MCVSFKKGVLSGSSNWFDIWFYNYFNYIFIGMKNKKHSVGHQTDINWCPVCREEEKKRIKMRKKIKECE